MHGRFLMLKTFYLRDCHCFQLWNLSITIKIKLQTKIINCCKQKSIKAIKTISLKHLWKHLGQQKILTVILKPNLWFSRQSLKTNTTSHKCFYHYIQPKHFSSFLIWQLGICLPLTQLCCLAALLICCCHPWKTGLWVAWSGLPPCGWQQVGAVAAGGWQSWQLCLSARLWANAMSSSMSPAFLQKIIVSDLYPSSYKVLSDNIWIFF